MPATDINTLLAESTCYACVAPGDVPTLAQYALWSRMASGSSPSFSAPVAAAATNALPTSFSANWGAVSGATGYFLDVSTDPLFGSFVAGFSNLNVANVVTYSVTGLAGSTTYYYRVRATNGTLTSASSNVITTATIFNPASIAGLQIWVRSDTGVYSDAAKTTPAANGDPVYTWDNMGNGAIVTDFIQATLARRPTYNTSGTNGKPKLVFATSMMGLIGNIANPFTVLVVVKNTSNSAVAAFVFGAASTNPHIAFPSTGGPTSVYAYSTAVAAGNALMGNVPGLIMVDFPTGTPTAGSRKQINTAVDGSGGLFAQTLIDPAIGNYAADATYYLNGDYYEIMVYDTLLSAGNITSLNGYFDTLYALPY